LSKQKAVDAEKKLKELSTGKYTTSATELVAK